LRAKRALLGSAMRLKVRDPTAKTDFYGDLLTELISLRSLEAHQHIAIVGAIGLKKPLRLALVLSNRARLIGSMWRAGTLSRSGLAL